MIGKVTGSDVLHQVEQFFERVNFQLEYLVEKWTDGFFQWEVELTGENLKSYREIRATVFSPGSELPSTAAINHAFSILGQNQDLHSCQSAIIARFVKEQQAEQEVMHLATKNPNRSTNEVIELLTPRTKNLLQKELQSSFNNYISAILEHAKKPIKLHEETLRLQEQMEGIINRKIAFDIEELVKNNPHLGVDEIISLLPPETKKWSSERVRQKIEGCKATYQSLVSIANGSSNYLELLHSILNRSIPLSQETKDLFRNHNELSLEGLAKLLCLEKMGILKHISSDSEAATVNSTTSTLEGRLRRRDENRH